MKGWEWSNKIIKNAITETNCNFSMAHGRVGQILLGAFTKKDRQKYLNWNCWNISIMSPSWLQDTPVLCFDWIRRSSWWTPADICIVKSTF